MALALALAAAAGCGGGDEEGGEGRATDTAARTQTGPPPPTETERTDARTETAPTGDGHGGGQDRPESPEEQPGGAGDEEPARSQALFTGRAGRVSPRMVRVPPFISVRVVLRSADGQSYGLRIGGRTLRAGGPLGSASVTLDGLRPGRAYAGSELETGVRVRVEASAEPGP